MCSCVPSMLVVGVLSLSRVRAPCSVPISQKLATCNDDFLIQILTFLSVYNFITSFDYSFHVAKLYKDIDIVSSECGHAGSKSGLSRKTSGCVGHLSVPLYSAAPHMPFSIMSDGGDDMERPSLSLDPDPSYLIRFYYTYLSVTLLPKEGGYPIPSPPPPFYVPIHVTYLRSLRATKEKRRPWPTRTPTAEEDSPTLTKK